MRKIDIPEDVLLRIYVSENRSAAECSDVLGVGTKVIFKCIDKYGIPRHHRTKRHRHIISEEWLKDNYVDNRKSITECAELFGCSISTMWLSLKSYNIPRRTLVGEDNPSKSQSAREAKGILWRGDNNPSKKPENRALRSQRLSGENNHMKLPKYREWARERIRGDKNPAWRDGRSGFPYCYKFNNNKKEEIRNQFDRKCFVCARSENDNHGQRLPIHHVDYNKMQGCDRRPWVLIPLCHRCHTKTNINRWYWFALLYNYWVYKYELDIMGFGVVINVRGKQ